MEPEHYKEQPEVSSSTAINYGLGTVDPYYLQDRPKRLDDAYKDMESIREPTEVSWKAVFILCAIGLVVFFFIAAFIQHACR